jgi:hypothetical protein
LAVVVATSAGRPEQGDSRWSGSLVVAQLVAAYWFSNEVSPFFYQQF